MNSWVISIFVFFLAAGYSKLPVIYLHRICDVDNGELNLPKMCDVDDWGAQSPKNVMSS